MKLFYTYMYSVRALAPYNNIVGNTILKICVRCYGKQKQI